MKTVMEANAEKHWLNVGEITKNIGYNLAPPPKPTKSWQPLRHDEFWHTMLDTIYDQGFTIKEPSVTVTDGSMSNGVGKEPTPIEDGRLFGVARLTPIADSQLAESFQKAGYEPLIGFRNCNDKTSSAYVGLGSWVTVCTNMIIAAEITMSRKHTTNILNDFQPMMQESFAELKGSVVDQQERIESYQQTNMDDEKFRMLIEDAVYREGIFPSAKYGELVTNWYEDPRFPERTLYSAWNSMTTTLGLGQDDTASLRRTVNLGQKKGKAIHALCDKYAYAA